MVHSNGTFEDDRIILHSYKHNASEIWRQVAHIGNKIHTSHLLHHLSNHTQQRPVPEPLRSILENHLERAFRGSLSFFDDGSCDIVDFNVDAWVVNGKGAGI